MWFEEKDEDVLGREMSGSSGRVLSGTVRESQTGQLTLKTPSFVAPTVRFVAFWSL